MKYLYLLFFIVFTPFFALSQKNVTVAMFVDGVDTTNNKISNSLLRAGDKLLKKNKIGEQLLPQSIFGWNFLGSSDGTVNISSLGTESFRAFQNLHVRYVQDEKSLNSEELELYAKRMKENGIGNYLSFFEILEMIQQGAMMVDSLLVEQFGDSSVKIEQLSKLNLDKIDSRFEPQFQAISSECTKGMMRGMTMWKEVYNKAVEDYNVAKQRIESLTIQRSNPRYKLGDDFENFADLNYGNRNVMCDKYDTGTALVGLLVAKCESAKIMPIRVNAEGESFDKDIYHAIRFAVDNGAKVIVITEVKPLSPFSDKIEEMIQYAAKKDVVVIIGAGDKGKNLNLLPYYPLASDCDNVIRVGATSSNEKIAKFSNFGENNVDVFAWGDEVESIYRENQVVKMSGTAVSASIVGGLVANLRAKNPKMKAAQVKDEILKASKKVGDILIIQ